MLRQLLNELQVNVEIAGRSGLLVKDGRYTEDVKKRIAGEDRDLSHHLPDMMFFTTDPLAAVQKALASLPNSLGLQELHYAIPGSSVRGAWRSHLERVLRSLGEPKVCDPLSDEETPPHAPYRSCSSVYGNKEEVRPAVPYGASCPVCRLFGNTVLGGRISFSDATPYANQRAGEPELIDGISISRYTGSVAGKYRALVLRNARFAMTLRLQNFELWHLGLLANLFADLAACQVPLGSGKNKGLGKVRAAATSMTLTEYGLTDPSGKGHLLGIAERLKPDAAAVYDMHPVENPPEISLPKMKGEAGWRHIRYSNKPEEIRAFWDTVRPCFNQGVWDDFRPLAEARPSGGGA
jgi:CRISPR/Cas system CSM-associated protein Csm3 (group 7 of RAMP superfamily)